MTLNSIEKIDTGSKYYWIPSDLYAMKTLLKEISEALEIEQLIDHKHNNKESFYLKNSLHHKLIRISKEFEFIRSNIRNFRKLTPREREIVQLLATGMNNPDIAEYLSISRYTVEQHHKHINNKLLIKSLPHLLKYAYAFDLI